MAPISDEEKLRRRTVNASVVGTNAMEGLQLDAETLRLMKSFEDGQLTREQLSSAIDQHVAGMLADRESRSREVASNVDAA